MTVVTRPFASREAGVFFPDGQHAGVHERRGDAASYKMAGATACSQSAPGTRWSCLSVCVPARVGRDSIDVVICIPRFARTQPIYFTYTMKMKVNPARWWASAAGRVQAGPLAPCPMCASCWHRTLGTDRACSGSRYTRVWSRDHHLYMSPA